MPSDQSSLAPSSTDAPDQRVGSAAAGRQRRVPRPADELSAKAASRREQILQAARRVFVERGYYETTLKDVAQEAGCAVGTLYTYFQDRGELLGAVLQEVEEEMRAASGRVNGNDPRDMIAAANRAYVESYARNVREMALLEQVAQLDSTVGEQRTARARGFVERNQRLIARLQEARLVDTALDAEMIALSLSVLVSRLCYLAFVEHMVPGSGVVDRVVDSVNLVWFRTLGLED